MHTATLFEPTPDPFNFRATARAHGWAALAPFAWHEASETLSRVHRLDNNTVVRLRMQSAANAVQVHVEAAAPLAAHEEQQVRHAVRRMLRLDEDLTPFYALQTELPGWQLQVVPGGGRLLRCPRLFEDIVYTLCTTNIAWTGTKRMVARLVEALGVPHPVEPTWRAFPAPATIAAAGPDALQQLGFGYRSAYLWDLATAVAQERLDLAALADPDRPTAEIRRDLLAIKGIGNYAAATILMLLGRYEHLAIDTELRAFVSQKYHGGQPVTEEEIRTLYAAWGPWRYLAYWFDPPA